MFDLYQNIKKYRIELGLTQTQLAEKAGYADKTMISKIESGKVDLTFSKIKVFADILSLTPSQLMGNAICEKEESNMKTESASERMLYEIEEAKIAIFAICDELCRWRKEITDEDYLFAEHCAKDCPLERL
jgi:transcriptional regulator with XRE-family HTH domain